MVIVVSLVIFTCFNAKVRKPTSRLKHSCSFTTAESRVNRWPVNYLSPKCDFSCCSFKGRDYSIGCSLHVIVPIIVSDSYLFLTAKLLKQGYRYHKIRKAFSQFFHRHSELIVKYNIGLKTLLQQGISEPIFYGDLVYKFKRIVGKPNFSGQFKKIVKTLYKGWI